MSMISSNHVFLLWELSLCFQNCKFFLVTRIQFPVEKLRFVPLRSQYKKWRPWIVPHTKKSANTSDRKTSRVVPEEGINILMSLKGDGLAILTRSHWNAGFISRAKHCEIFAIWNEMSNNTDDREADERANNCAQGWVIYVRAEYPLK